MEEHVSLQMFGIAFTHLCLSGDRKSGRRVLIWRRQLWQCPSSVSACNTRVAPQHRSSSRLSPASRTSFCTLPSVNLLTADKSTFQLGRLGPPGSITKIHRGQQGACSQSQARLDPTVSTQIGHQARTVPKSKARLRIR